MSLIVQGFLRGDGLECSLGHGFGRTNGLTSRDRSRRIYRKKTLTDPPRLKLSTQQGIHVLLLDRICGALYLVVSWRYNQYIASKTNSKARHC
jgi:hypothetical protein